MKAISIVLASVNAACFILTFAFYVSGKMTPAAIAAAFYFLFSILSLMFSIPMFFFWHSISPGAGPARCRNRLDPSHREAESCTT